MKRIGYHNDFFTASDHPRALDNDFVKGTDIYSQVQKESPDLQVVGEMPYPGDEGGWGLNKVVDIWEVLKVFRDHHYTSFSASHNVEPNIEAWKKKTLTPDSLRVNNILFKEAYFKNKDGAAIKRSAYEFIRDHLGYRLYLNKKKTDFKIEERKLTYKITLENVGFSAIHNPRPVYLVFLGEDKLVDFKVPLKVDPNDWQPYDPQKGNYKILQHQIEGRVAIPLEKGNYKIGLWMPDASELLKHDSKYAIQLSNPNLSVWEDSNHQYRINIIGSMSL